MRFIFREYLLALSGIHPTTDAMYQCCYKLARKQCTACFYYGHSASAKPGFFYWQPLADVARELPEHIATGDWERRLQVEQLLAVMDVKC